MKEIESKRQSNKVKKKTCLLEAATRLFTQKGFENTSIDEIAKEAELTKRTLYQYFESKEDLFYAVVLEGSKKLLFMYEDAMSKGRNALEKIRFGNQAHLQYYMDDLQMFRLLNYRPANRKNCESSPHYKELEVLDSIRLKYYMELVEESKADCSINQNLDITKAVFFAFFSTYSLLYTVSSMNMWEKLHIGENDFLQFSFDLLADALKA